MDAGLWRLSDVNTGLGTKGLMESYLQDSPGAWSLGRSFAPWTLVLRLCWGSRQGGTGYKQEELYTLQSAVGMASVMLFEFQD